MEAAFVTDIFSSLPDNADPSAIRSAQDYVLLQQLLRMPIMISKTAQIQGDFLESWKIEDNHKAFTLNLKKNLHWSDNKSITAEDFLNTLNRQMRLKTSTHFNFAEIKKVDLIDQWSIKVTLYSSNTRFLKQLAYPEFGLIRSHQKDKLTFDDFKISSGPYSCESFSKKKITLVKNSFYGHSSESPSKIVIQSSDLENQLDGLKSEKVGFVIPAKSLSQTQHKNIEENKKFHVYDPHIGFTFWISINANSPLFKDKERRNYIQKVLMKSKLDFQNYEPFWQGAKQLYLPGGFGRPSLEEIEATWLKIGKTHTQKISSVKILMSKKFIFGDAIKKALEGEGILVTTEYYADLNEFTEMQMTKTFDLIQINNDFSSLDVSENLLVAFNANRPLIFTGADQKKYSDLLTGFLADSDPDETYKKAKHIGINLLEDGYVFPIAYYKTYFYLHKKIDITEWSQLFPDVKFWKVKVND